MDIKEVKFIVSNISFFSKLKKKDIDRFLKLCEIKEYKNGEVIYNESDPPDYFYLLLKGRVVAITEISGKDVEIELLKRSTCFGIISLITGEPHSVTTKSIETSYVLRVEKDKFKEFLNKRPLFSSEFFLTFSRRVKRRTQPKKIFQCKRIAVAGFPQSGKTTYMYNLGLQLKGQTGKKAVILEISPEDNFVLPLFTRKYKVLNLKEFREDKVDDYILRDLIDYMLVKTDNITNFNALINFLSENYHFIIFEIPYLFIDKYSCELLPSSDVLHFLLAPIREELKETGRIMRNLIKDNSINKEKIHLIFSEFKADDRLSFEEEKRLLDYPVYATLPSYESQVYFKAVRRVARQLGEVVLGLALGSGGAYAFAHIGVLKILQENNIPVDVICGSSMGALVAALWAAGFSIEEMENAVKWVGKKMGSFPFSGFSFPFKGFMRARRLESIFKGVFGDRTFYDLKHSLRIAAFDFIRREAVILGEGLIYKAVAASCAMPGVFEPIRFKKDILLDGGVLNPLPTRILLNYGAHKIIAVNITPTKEEIVQRYKKGQKFHIFDFIFGSIETMQREFIHRALELSDVIIHPQFGGGGWMAFDRVDEFVENGERAAKEKIADLRKLLIV
jgi:NTE family protein